MLASEALLQLENIALENFIRRNGLWNVWELVQDLELKEVGYEETEKEG